MRLGIFAKTFAGTEPDRVLGEAKAAGFAAVQYNMACSGLPSMPDAIGAGAVAAAAWAARRHGLAIAAVSGTYNMIHPDPATRAIGLRRLEVLAAACAGLGTSMVTLCTGTRDPTDQWRGHPDNGAPAAWRDLLTEMAKAVEIADRHDIRLGIEPELSNVVDSAKKTRLLIETLATDRVVVVLDPANLVEVVPLAEQRRIVADAVDAVGNRIVMAHAKDRAADGSFVAAGKGVLDFPYFVERLRSVGFDGDLVAHGLKPSEAAGVAAFLGGLA